MIRKRHFNSWKRSKQGLGKHSLAPEKFYSINFTDENAKFYLSLHYNGANCYLFVNVTEIIKFKASTMMFLGCNLLSVNTF